MFGLNLPNCSPPLREVGAGTQAGAETGSKEESHSLAGFQQLHVQPPLLNNVGPPVWGGTAHPGIVSLSRIQDPEPHRQTHKSV